MNLEQYDRATTPPHGLIRTRPELALLSLDDQTVVFSEATQSVLGLSPAASLVFEQLREGCSAAALTRILVAQGLVGPDAAEQWLHATLDAFAAHGLLDGAAMPPVTVAECDTDDAAARRAAAECAPYARFEPAAQQRYRLLGTGALIRYGHVAQIRLVNSVLGHLATDDTAAPDIVFDLAAELLDNGHLRSDVYRDGRPVGRARRLSHVAPIVKASFWQSAINNYDFLFYVHAGVVGTDTGCILLPAAPGSGKSSLTVALVHRGLRYFSDEVALIEPGSFHVPPVPLATCVKSTGWQLMTRYHPELASLPVHWRSDDKRLRYIPPPPGAGQQAAAPVSHIVFPQYRPDAATRLAPLPRSEALARLMGECLALRQRLDQDNVRALVRWIASIDCYELPFSSLDDAVAAILQATTTKHSTPD